MIKFVQHLNYDKNNYAQIFFWGAVFVFTLIHIIIYVLMPYTCDDYWYMIPLREYCMGIDSTFPSEALWECWLDHYQNDNIRLSNIVFTFTLLLPKIIPSILSGLFVGVMLWQSAKLVGISWRNPLLFVLLLFGVSFLLPWYEQMFTQCFALNYVWATVLTLALALVFWNKHTKNISISILLGVIVGAWHEGFSVPLLVGFITYLALNRREINRQRIAIICAMIVGLLWLISAPGLQANVGYKTNTLQLSVVLGKLIKYHVPLFILLLSVLVAATKKETRKQIIDPIFLSFVSICVTGVLLNIITNVGARTGWMGYLFGIIATLYLCKNFKEQRYNYGKSILKRILIIIISLFLLIHYIVVVYYAVKVKNEVEYVLEQYEKSPDGLVFADVTYDYQALPLVWKKPYFEIFTYDLVMYWKDKYYNDCAKQMRVIPTCLHNADKEIGEKVKGDNPFFIYHGFLYAPIDSSGNYEKMSYYEIDFGCTKKVLKCSNFAFTSTNGENFYFSFPQRATVHRWIGEIEEMNRCE